MRRLLKEVASGAVEMKGDTSTLEDFSVLAKLGSENIRVVLPHDVVVVAPRALAAAVSDGISLKQNHVVRMQNGQSILGADKVRKHQQSSDKQQSLHGENSIVGK